MRWIGLLLPFAAIAPAPAARDRIAVVTAARDLHPGIPIGEDDLVGVLVEPGHLPEGVFVSPVHVVDRVPHERILADEWVRAERLVDPAGRRGLAAVLPRGYRAVRVPLPRAGEYLHPGAHVELWTPEPLPGFFVVADVDGGAIAVIASEEDAVQIAHAVQAGWITARHEHCCLWCPYRYPDLAGTSTRRLDAGIRPYARVR